MAAGLADHLWTLRDLMSHHVPPPVWVAPKQRAVRPSRSSHRRCFGQSDPGSLWRYPDPPPTAERG